MRGIESVQSVGISSSHLQITFRVLWLLGTPAEWEGRGRAIRVTMLILNSGVHVHVTLAAQTYGTTQWRLSQTILFTQLNSPAHRTYIDAFTYIYLYIFVLSFLALD